MRLYETANKLKVSKTHMSKRFFREWRELSGLKISWNLISNPIKPHQIQQTERRELSNILWPN